MGTGMADKTIPHWNMNNVFPSIESGEYESAIFKVNDLIANIETIFSNEAELFDNQNNIASIATHIGKLIDMLNELYKLSGTIRAYLYSFITTNSYDKIASKKMSEFEQIGVKIQNLGTHFQSLIGKLAPSLDAIISTNETCREHAFALQDAAEQSKYLMSREQESLATELNLSGAGAWNKLQGTITSQLTVDFELDGKIQKLPMPALINLRSHPDENTRHRAYETEINTWKTVEEPLAFALNGVKGTTITLNKHRGRIDALHPAIDMARIDRATLNAMIEAMQDSLPEFHRYFAAKAKLLGKEKLAWWDLFAPEGQSKQFFTWEEASEFIITNFDKFSPELSKFASRAFEENWIDAEQRDGKRGGAFCMSIPAIKESRILCNFDGSLDQVSTIAHELGHAYHNECAFNASKTEMQQDTPMTLAETASIMCETIIMEAVLAQTTNKSEQLAILGTKLIGDSQVIVDIYSRYLFEKEIFERRAQSELSPEDFCNIMEQAQKNAYGENLDHQFLMKYAWTWKPHYYYTGLSFYNFPYAFGLLFATGLYAIYKKRGAEFIPEYKKLLSHTGEAYAAELATTFDIDIKNKKFWNDGLKIIASNIEKYIELAESI